MEDELVILNKKLEQLSFQDGLTNIANRRLFDQTLDGEWNHARRNQQPISLIFLDIDDFKKYNDHYGHQAGDECLKKVANALSKIPTRTTDLVARYGGEEFVLLLPNASAESAIEMAEKCREMILNLNIKHQTSSVRNIVTVSSGVCTIVPTVETSPSALFSIADKMLYQAKKNGRNRVEFC